jgi:hypothetical protein
VLLARDCAPLERDHTWPATEDVLQRHTASAIGAVIFAVSALEAAVNELHQDAIDRSHAQLGAAARVAPQIEQLWDTVDRAPLLRKYQWFLSLADLPLLEAGAEPLQTATDVIEVRDALIHYKPEWHDLPRDSRRLEARLANKFPLNALSMPDQTFIPYRCCGYGCAVWSLRGVTAFLSHFYERLGVESKKVAAMGEAVGTFRDDAA